ncbi:MAG: hypothetical protein ACXVJT_00910 [Thermoanaerobaculia bacterium]
MNRILIANWGVHILHATWQSAVVALAMIAFKKQVMNHHKDTKGTKRSL